MIVCYLCEKSFVTKSNLYRHLRNIHGEVSVQVRVRKCVQCSFECSTTIEMKNHMESLHSRDETKLCVYCSKTFHTLKSFNSHLKLVHSLPTISASRVERIHRPEKSAFNGTAETFFLAAKPDDFDFLQFMIDQKSVIKEIVQESLERESRKLQFSANLIVEKPSLVAEEKKELPIHVNSKMETVYMGDGLSDEAFANARPNGHKSSYLHNSWKWLGFETDYWFEHSSCFSLTNKRVFIHCSTSLPGQYEMFTQYSESWW